MKRRLTIVLILAAALIVTCFVGSYVLSGNVRWKDRGGASAERDPSISSGLAQVLAEAGSNDLIEVGVEQKRY